MPNVYNEVILNGNTLVNLRQDTITSAQALSGATFHKADGTTGTGSIATYSGATTVRENGTLATAGKYVASDIEVAVSGGGSAEDLDFIMYHDNMLQIEDGTIPPTSEEYETILTKGYAILDYVFRGVI